MQMVVGLLILDIIIPGSNSLKEKRLALKSIKDKVGNRFNVSIAEIDFQDKWQRTKLGIVQIGNDYGYIDKNLQTVFNLIDQSNLVEIVQHNLEYL
jgi:uncharacterized protein YlxP (DUF503 family)